MEKLPANITTVQQQKAYKYATQMCSTFIDFTFRLQTVGSLSSIHLLTYVLLAEMPRYNSVWHLVTRIGWIMLDKSSYEDVEPKKYPFTSVFISLCVCFFLSQALIFW